MHGIKIGWAQISITPDRPTFNGGQIYPRVSKYVHDPLTATALALDDGEAQALMLSMDMMSAPVPEVIRRVRESLCVLPGFRPECLSVSVTHTHNAIAPHPFLFDEEALKMLGEERIALPEIPNDLLSGDELNDYLADRMTQVAMRAWENRQAGGVSAASDYAAVAFNRRPIFEKEGACETLMYGVCARDDFARYEAGSDHSADMLYTWAPDGHLTGVLVCIPCPSQVFELHSFLSADYWHYTRQAIREKLGNVFVLPLCGASGDQSPLDLTRISKHNHRELEAWGAQAGEVLRNFDMADECREIADRITEAVVRGMRKARNAIDSQPLFRHMARSLKLPIRQVSEAEYTAAKLAVEEAQSRFSPDTLMEGADLVRVFEPMGIVGRYFQQNRSPYVDVPMHYLIIGDTALVLCPFELFTEYSLRIKARAASAHTVVVQLTDMYLGYLPTRLAIDGGSYSSAPASTTCGPCEGSVLVEDALARILELRTN